MSLNKYVSEIKTVNHNPELIYRFLSDFNNLGKLLNESVLQQISNQAPQIKIESFEADTDSCKFTIRGQGEAGFRIVNREPYKTVKISGAGKLPAEILMWIQIVPVSPYQSKMRITLHAELNLVMKMMVGKKLKEGVDKLADLLSMVPYSML
jgi:carbon monoxide dehydrogenase subunit G